MAARREAGRGQRLGRPPAMTTEQIEHARALLTNADNTATSIEKLLKVSRSTIYKYVPDLTGGQRELTAGGDQTASSTGPGG